MTDRYSFTEEEWRLVVAAPYVVGISAMIFDPTLTSLVMEIAALKKIVRKAAEQYGHNALVQACIQDTDTFNQNESRRAAEMKVASLLEMFREVLTVVDLKAEPDEAQDYRYFLYEVGERMTEVAAEGFLGLGPKTSDREYEYLSRLEEWLGV